MAQKILVVDDDRTNLRVIESGLTQQGFEVDIAIDGDVGLEKVKTAAFDLIVLDIQMPRVNGYTFLLEIKKIKNTQKIPIIVLTAHNEWEAIFRYKGVRDYMVKPIKFEVLLEKINKLLKPPASPEEPQAPPKPSGPDEMFH